MLICTSVKIPIKKSQMFKKVSEKLQYYFLFSFSENAKKCEFCAIA